MYDLSYNMDRFTKPSLKSVSKSIQVGGQRGVVDEDPLDEDNKVPKYHVRSDAHCSSSLQVSQLL